MSMKKVLFGLVKWSFFVGGLATWIYFLSLQEHPNPPKSNLPEMMTYEVKKRSFAVNVETTGELEAAQSTLIASAVRGDLGKIIYLIADGTSVPANKLLVKLDATPFEETIEDLEQQVKEQESKILGLKHKLAWDISAAEHDQKMATLEEDTAHLEIKKIIEGDGPLEKARLQGLVQKAAIKYEEMQGYANDLESLEQQGFLNPSEKRQAEKKLNEEKEAYENARMQYESYVNHVLPMQIMKAEAALKRARSTAEEAARSTAYNIQTTQFTLAQAEQQLTHLHESLENARKELKHTEILSPYEGMVVHREDFRQGQRRKPRVGDNVLKNQPIMDLPDLNSMLVKTRIREIDLHKVSIGKQATISIDSYPNLFFSGKVHAIGVLALTDITKMGDEKYFDVTIALDKNDSRLRPGMTAHVTIHSDQIDNALTIPIYALFEMEKQHYCYLSSEDEYLCHPISVGKANQQWVEILDGLKENDVICLSEPPSYTKTEEPL
ncbi:efflux RND transporter periplasmic adaptor subunit [Parachlamydia acanthamoebae]|nr:efflux RND transporter periplasmic adaptor subunit [Parachlamydia acanthamoebae]